MGEQRTFAGLAWDGKKKRTRREQFLGEMNAVIPWAALLALVEPHYPTGKGAIPDETTILHFRHLLEAHQLTEAMFDVVRRLLEGRGLLLKSGTVVDATIISAPSSTKNATDTRDPEMKHVRKGKMWYFGMKVHTGSDRRGIVHALTTTDAAAAEIMQMPQLLHGEEREVFGRSGLLVGGRSPGGESVRRSVSRQSTADETAADRTVEADQSRALADPGAGRASVPGRQASVGLYEGALSGIDEEHGARVRRLRIGQSLSHA
jgi:hypothetical protein